MPRPNRLVVLLLGFWISSTAALLSAQDQQPPPAPPPGQTLTPDQLNDLVAPIALYPDELLSQIMVAAFQSVGVRPTIKITALNKEARDARRSHLAHRLD